MTEPAPYPFRTAPYLRTKVWGGDKLEKLFGKKSGSGDGPTGETWEVADLEEGQSQVDTGPLAGSSLGELVDGWGEDLIGTASSSDAFPLLVKIIDAAEDLSVQVHPSEEDVATTFPEADSKDECWLVIEADEDGSILHGVREGVDADSFRRAVDEGNAVKCLRRVPVEPGHVVRVVPGTIHAICSGVTLLEIQQPSDTTFRVYDYDRLGLDGEPRELHLDEAMQVANFGDQPPSSLTGNPTDFEAADVELLVDVPAYRIERASLPRTTDWRVADASPQVLFAQSGAGRVTAPTLDEPIEVSRGDTIVVPAAVDRVRAEPTDETIDLVASGLGGIPVLAN